MVHSLKAKEKNPKLYFLFFFLSVSFLLGALCCVFHLGILQIDVMASRWCQILQDGILGGSYDLFD